MKKIFPLFIFIILLISLVSAQYETIQGIEQSSMEYEDYKSCVDSCTSCELNCKSRLLEQAAEINQNENFCLQLIDQTRKMFCLDNIYRTKSITQKDISLCDKISVEDEKERCKINVILTKAIENENEAECNSLTETQIENCKSSFYQSMAFQKQDKSYCNKLNDVAKQNCLQQIEETTFETTEALTTTSTIDYKKIGMYAGIGMGAILFLILIIFLIRKISKPNKPKEVPLVVQQKPQPQTTNVNPTQQKV
ncbi:MAG: hypothetical protein KKA65_00390 [Nanoarchaeota archaeon]|nr:hypothetical protein [Nanoarchaeota archaeon]MBU4455940.1 hypothetical protein [Nanoarchaeota archaeon]